MSSHFEKLDTWSRGPIQPRRKFLRQACVGTAACGTVAGIGGFDWLNRLDGVSASEARLGVDDVRFSDDIEPTVRLLEETPRDELIEVVADRVKKNQLSYREVLAALLLAGVRNVQPRPSVGFKFHAVLVVNSCHLASLASSDKDRWLPIFWGLDYFKSSQARDVREGNWTMAAVNENAMPKPHQARRAFIDAMDNWDEEAVDVAAAAIARSLPSTEIFELFARYAARDFRSIGHKAIYVANAYRTLNCIGWRYSEPVLRSLAYALLNHNGQPNPSSSDLDADRPWRLNQPRAETLGEEWASGESSVEATRELLGVIRSGESDEAGALVAAQLAKGVGPQSIIDGLFLSSGELLMRQPGIVGLHTLTTTNAIRFLFATARDPNTRKMLLMQNASFLPMFRQEMHRRGDVAEHRIDELSGEDQPAMDIDEIYDAVSNDKMSAATGLLGQMSSGMAAESFMDGARKLIFLKGSDSHDYKFSSAVLEDYYHVSPEWRDRFLAASVFQLRGARGRDLPLASRIRGALES